MKVGMEAAVEGRPAVTSEGVGGSPVEDAVLLHRIARGDRAALVSLYERHAGMVLAHIGLVTGDRGLSEEILQDTMLAVWRGAASFRGDSKVRSWIIAIARRQARDRLRRHRLAVIDDTVLSGHPASDPGPEDLALERAQLTAVADAIGSLSLIHREVLGLVFGAGLTLAETADALEIPLGTVKSRLGSARNALSRSLSERGYAR